ncbi:hypothetical protein BRADI_3g61016v3 [Brachypodium distachyon]|uniref:Uncharacterized protein n=1 Tax=Brachypodium distachyon TaxID=15368 RepID=A0A0Q3FS33_BRADI|nr:hypothetical protein BRADI_3g61016v3 [Brachypodium distachyon]
MKHRRAEEKERLRPGRWSGVGGGGGSRRIWRGRPAVRQRFGTGGGGSVGSSRGSPVGGEAGERGKEAAFGADPARASRQRARRRWIWIGRPGRLVVLCSGLS